jgi:hypothetical protein
MSRSKACTVLCSLRSRDRGFKSHSGHGCLVFVCVCAFFCVFIQVEALRRADHPAQVVLPNVLRFSKPKWNGVFHGGSQGPNWGCSAKGKKNYMRYGARGRFARVFFIVSGVRLSPPGTAATTGLLYHPQMIDDGECGEISGMKIGRGNRSTRRNPASVPLCPPQIPHDPNRARTRAAAVGSQRLTAWAMARPKWEVVNYIESTSNNLFRFQEDNRKYAGHVYIFSSRHR